jgi:hypothetical protein
VKDLWTGLAHAKPHTVLGGGPDGFTEVSLAQRIGSGAEVATAALG